jgi:hypothetical protein
MNKTYIRFLHLSSNLIMILLLFQFCDFALTILNDTSVCLWFGCSLVKGGMKSRGKNEVAHYSYLFPPHPTHIRDSEPESGLWRVRRLGAGTWQQCMGEATSEAMRVPGGMQARRRVTQSRSMAGGTMTLGSWCSSKRGRRGSSSYRGAGQQNFGAPTRGPYRIGHPRW